MKVKIQGVTFELRSIPGPVWFDEINRRYDESKSDTEFQKLLMFHSIKSWDLKDESGNVLELSLDNFVNKLSAVHYTRLLLECKDINGISENEKKAFAALLSGHLAGKNESTSGIAGPVNTSGENPGKA